MSIVMNKGQALAENYPQPEFFSLGVNYWPRSRAMYWWKDYDGEEVREDFIRLAEYECRIVRIFLQWEDFQPRPDWIAAVALNHLVDAADAAVGAGVKLMPTLFCGHMSGVNWFPGWMLEAGGVQRFPVFCGGRLDNRYQVRNFYNDVRAIQAQVLQCREVARALKGHPGIWGYDLGNESSNCVIPPHREAARVWLETMVGELKVQSGGLPVILGMHAEDLEEDRNLWPQDAARYCDFLCMHGYPFYLDWVEDELDARVLPFLGAVTRWLGQKPVLFQEFGITGRPLLPPFYESGEEGRFKTPLWSEETGAFYYRRALNLLHKEGMIGAMAWCYGDYHPELWSRPPLDVAPHERHFGLFRYDGSPKVAALAWQDFVGETGLQLTEGTEDKPWLEGEEREQFYQEPRDNLQRMYRRYLEYSENRG
ncbi:MAG: hypothetical protein GX964_01950 [Syntrophomonadaceae bacterium]|jgi:endo-1,4-beta-mannosidase|nr:hypothetical protein [Syntrophomonadaceae bacterium]